MNVLYILDFYVKNHLSLSKVDYLDKLNHLTYFANQPINIQSVVDYCQFRTLQGVKNSTINRELNIIRAAINFYNKHNDTNLKNPFNGFNLFESDYLPRYLTADECKRLLNASLLYAGDSHQLYHFINLALNTGCRSGELKTLKWDAVDFDNSYMTVRNSLSKNRKTIHKPLNYQALLSLKELSNGSEWVFYSTRTGKNRSTFKKAFAWTCDKADLGHVRIHDLRHTFASLLVQNGVPLYHVMQLLGHSDIKTTQKYAHLSPNNLAHVVDSLPQFA